MLAVLQAVRITIAIYLPAWGAGVVAALFLSATVWLLGSRAARVLYYICAGISFIPVTILLPYFLRLFGLNCFVYPLIALPVFLVMFASFYEAFSHSNLARLSLMTNYGMSRSRFFSLVLLRESIPTLYSSLRFSLSFSFAIFLALDYFLESWGGLGSLVHFYYYRVTFDFVRYNVLMVYTVLCAGLIGSIQVAALALILRPFTEFRKHL